MVNSNRELAELIAKACDDKKGRDVVLMNMEGLTVTTDYFVIASAGSVNQAKAIADNIEEVVMENTQRPFLHREGYSSGEWILLDYGDVVAHVFKEDSREYYALENLWGDAELTPYEAKQ